MKRCFALLSLLSASLSTAATVLPRPADQLDLDRPFDSVLWITTHNAANFGSLVPNQELDLHTQLERGARGLMLDIWEVDGRLFTCHQNCALHGRKALLEDDLQTINRFLQATPDAIITLHLEDHVTRPTLAAFIARRPDLFARSFDPTDPRWLAASPRWPSLRQLIAAGQRLLITTQRSELSGPYAGSRAWLIHDQSLVAENYWSLGNTIFTHDNRCVPRWEHVPLDDPSGTQGLPRLFVMNHFHGVPLGLHSRTDNRLDVVLERLQSHCLPAAGRMPNYLAIDFIEQGDMLEFAETYNHGGVLAYPQRGATGQPICSFSLAFDRQWRLDQLPRMGCENDSIRSLVLRGVRAGQQLILYADAGAAAGTDHTVIDVLRDIPWHAPQPVDTLDVDQQSAYLRVRHHGRGALDGHVSQIATRPAIDPGAGDDADADADAEALALASTLSPATR